MDFLDIARLISRAFIEALDGGEKCLCCSAEAFSKPLCSSCEKDLLGEIGKCKRSEKSDFIDEIFPLFLYADWKKHLLSEWKMNGNRSLSPFFADCIATALFRLKWQNFPIVPIPPRPRKIFLNGFDQIDELSHFLHERHKIKIKKVLKRVSTVEQKHLSKAQRAENSKKSFLLKNANVGKLTTPVILLDDVITTGATLDACAKILKDAGIKKVFAITLFSTSKF